MTIQGCQPRKPATDTPLPPSKDPSGLRDGRENKPSEVTRRIPEGVNPIDFHGFLAATQNVKKPTTPIDELKSLKVYLEEQVLKLKKEQAKFNNLFNGQESLNESTSLYSHHMHGLLKAQLAATEERLSTVSERLSVLEELIGLIGYA